MYTATTLFKLVFQIFWIAHILGCGFIILANYMIENGRASWRDDLAESDSITVYLDALYFAIITMSTVGYGDISPISPHEKLYTIIITIISCG